MYRLLFPIFVPCTLWLWSALFLEEQSTNWDLIKGTGPANSGFIYVMGAIIVVPLMALVQGTFGLLSLWLLRKCTKLWQFAGFGTALGTGLTSLCVSYFTMPLGASPFGFFSTLWVFFVPPLAAGYALTFYFECHKRWRFD